MGSILAIRELIFKNVHQSFFYAGRIGFMFFTIDSVKKINQEFFSPALYTDLHFVKLHFALK